MAHHDAPVLHVDEGWTVEMPTLFDIDPPPQQPSLPGLPAETPAELSAGRRLTLRQSRDLEVGRHPLTRGPLHPDAAPAGDRDAPGARCGGCVFRRPGRYPKCWWGADQVPAGQRPPRYSNGPATDVRGWWPGCADWQPQKPPT